jgi:hypothetical protein
MSLPGAETVAEVVATRGSCRGRGGHQPHLWAQIQPPWWSTWHHLPSSLQGSRTMTAPSFLQRHLSLLQRSVGHRWSRSGAASRAPAAGRAPPATRRSRHPPAVGASGTDGLDPERRVGLLQRHVGLDLLQRSARRAPLLRWVKLLHQLARQAPLQRPAHRAPPAAGRTPL